MEFKSPAEYRAEARRHREMAMLTNNDAIRNLMLDLAAGYDELARRVERLRRLEPGKSLLLGATDGHNGDGRARLNDFLTMPEQYPLTLTDRQAKLRPTDSIS